MVNDEEHRAVRRRHFAGDGFHLLLASMTMSDRKPGTFSISDLRRRPEFFDMTASRVWHAWWKRRGFSLNDISGRLLEHMDDNPMPFALVAHEGRTFKGSTLVIESDVQDRPQYSPWVAAVWVDADHRKQGVGAALIEHAANAVFELGMGSVYLCSTRTNRDFYLTRGWTQVEEDIGADLLTIMLRRCEP